jgi:DNA repair photolyase
MSLKKNETRFFTLNVCRGCGGCKDHQFCNSARSELRDYSGVRFTSDGFDCALPVSIDSHSHCSYGCLYCFSDNLMQHQAGTFSGVGQTSLLAIEKLFDGDPKNNRWIYQKALKYDNKKNGYPCPVQLGAINDPCDQIERNQGWLLRFIDLAIKYNQPVRISTKGDIFLAKEYLDAIGKAPHLFWVAFSIISIDDEIIAKIDRRAPTPSRRLKTMKALSDIGVKTSLRFRPILPGISDRTIKHPMALRELIEKAAVSGAKAISYETAFYPGAPTKELKLRWKILSDFAGYDLEKLYKSFGTNQACNRPAYTFVEDIMHKVKEIAIENKLTVGVSDPCWKQLTETGCCCGILPDDPVFGNWQRENATTQLVVARDTGKLISAKDAIPAWAYDSPSSFIINSGAGPLVKYKDKHEKWSDVLSRTWNQLDTQRSALNYFQGALLPVDRDSDNDILYKYVGLQRQYKESIFKTDQ